MQASRSTWGSDLLGTMGVDRGESECMEEITDPIRETLKVEES